MGQRKEGNTGIQKKKEGYRGKENRSRQKEGRKVDEGRVDEGGKEGREGGEEKGVGEDRYS